MTKSTYRPISLEEVNSLTGERLLNVRVYGKVHSRNLSDEVLILTSLAEEIHSSIKVDFKLILKETVASLFQIDSVVQILGEFHCQANGDKVLLAHIIRDFSGVKPSLYQKYVFHYPLNPRECLLEETRRKLDDLKQPSESQIEDLESEFLKYHREHGTGSEEDDLFDD